jgi:hypothetical protein
MSAANTVMLRRINSIIEEYRVLGYKMTLRQLYYQLVSRDVIPNKVSEYEKIGNLLVKGRMCGIVDWDAIEDRIRIPKIPYSVDDVNDALEDTVRHYRLDRQLNQNNYVELWVEKDALSNILYEKTAYYHIKMMVNRGYSSCTAMFDAYNRFARAIKSGKNEVFVLYLGDHDPSGLDMIRDIRDRIIEFLSNSSSMQIWFMDTFEAEVEQFQEWLDSHITVKPIALTSEQIKQYNPPPNPTKLKDPRSKWYLENFGNTSWEVDALRPDVLHSIIDEQITDLLDMDEFKSMLSLEQTQRQEISKYPELKQNIQSAEEIINQVISSTKSKKVIEQLQTSLNYIKI